MKLFPLHSTDGYKVGHRPMYQKGSEMIYSNFTPRSDRLFKGGVMYDNKMVVFGIQGFIREFLDETFNENFFGQNKEKVVARYKRRMDGYLGPDVVPVDHIEALHNLGYLPLEVKSLPEGSRVHMGVPVMTVRNTHPDFFWLVNYLETVWSNSIWKSMTNATIAFEYRRVFDAYAELTGSPKEMVMWQGHDFSLRGMSGPEDGARSNAGHLLSFAGTDTISAIDYLEDYYNADADKELIGGSVPASEHSVSSSNILAIAEKMIVPANMDVRFSAEVEFLKNYITSIVPTGIASYVADTYDYWKVVTGVLPALKDVIMARDGKLVIRPDSGDPVKIICGYTHKTGTNAFDHGGYEAYQATNGNWYRTEDWDSNMYGDLYLSENAVAMSEAEVKGTIQCLWEIFGGEVNEAGYKVLDSHIGLIYGDSITLARQEEILRHLAESGFASCNVVLGVGSYTYNYNTRDTFGSAVKATATKIAGEYLEIYKDPATANNKKSAKGFLRVNLVDGEYVLEDQVDFEDNGGEMIVRFKDGIVYNETSLLEIRTNLHGGKF